MEFSELFKSSHLIEFSPNSKFIANIYNFRLCVRDAQSLQIKKYFTCIDICSKIEWSHDSRFLLALQEKRNLVQIFDLESENIFEINQGVAGAANARFAKVASSEDIFILVNSDFQLRISIWRISKNGDLSFVTHLQMPKFDERGLAFNSSHDRLALLERHEGKDFITIFKCGDGEFKTLSHFSIDTKNAVDLLWSSNSEYICTWDSLLAYNVLVYRPNGQLVKSYSAYGNALGLKTVSWSPTSSLLALGSYDNSIRLLDLASREIIAEFSHDSHITQLSVPIFREVPLDNRSTHLSIHGNLQTRYDVYQTPVQLEKMNVEFDRPNPMVGIGFLSFSPCGKYIMSKNDSIPNALFIWDLSKLSLYSIILQMKQITCASWNPVTGISGVAGQASQLCLVTGGDKMYLWSDEGCSCVDIPVEDFTVGKIVWSDNGTAAALIGRDSMCCCYPSTDFDDS